MKCFPLNQSRNKTVQVQIQGLRNVKPEEEIGYFLFHDISPIFKINVGGIISSEFARNGLVYLDFIFNVFTIQTLEFASLSIEETNEWVNALGITNDILQNMSQEYSKQKKLKESMTVLQILKKLTSNIESTASKRIENLIETAQNAVENVLIA